MRKHSLILLLLVLLLREAKAQESLQTLYGQVVDSLSQKGLPNSTITLVQKNTGKTLKSGSNNSGKFSFPGLIAGDYSLSIDYIGYQSFHIEKLTVKAGESILRLPAIPLHLEQQNLKLVTVTAARPFIVQGVDRIVLNVSESPIAAGGNAYDAVLRAPGMNEQNNGLHFRNRSVQVYINNRPSNLSGDDLKNMLTSLPANSIEQIEIIPNPSARYEANGAAIINIILAKNKNYGANYSVNAGMGSGRFFKDNAGIDFNYRNKSINVFGSYNYVHNEQYYNNNSLRYLSNSNIFSNEYDVRTRYNNAYTLGTDVQLSKNSSFGFLLNGYMNTRERNVNSNSGIKYTGATFDSTSNLITQGRARFASPSLNIYYKNILDSSRKELDINLDLFHFNQTWNDNFTTNYLDKNAVEYSAPTFLKDNSPQIAQVYSFSADYTQPTKHGRWESGIKIAYTKTDNNILWQNNTGGGWFVDSAKTNHFVYSENINAAYLNFVSNFKKFDLQLGVRAEQTNSLGNLVTLGNSNKQSYFNLFPNINLGYTKNANNIFSISYRQSITRFGFSVVNPFIIYQNQYSYMQGNPNIEPQIENTVSFSYNFKQVLSLGLDYVHVSKMLNQVYENADRNIVIQTYNNLSSGDVTDISATITKQFGFWTSMLSNVAGYGAYHISPSVSSTAQNSSGWLFYSQWQNSFNLKNGWSAELSSFYSAPMVYAAYHIQQIFYTGIGASKLILHKKASIKLSVSDLFNTKSQTSDYNSMGVDMHQNNKAESRFISISFRYKFGNKNVRAKSQDHSKINDIKSRIGN